VSEPIWCDADRDDNPELCHQTSLLLDNKFRYMPALLTPTTAWRDQTMSADVRAIAATYFASWKNRDFDTLRSILADDMVRPSHEYRSAVTHGELVEH
jgi:hypothetical protein